MQYARADYSVVVKNRAPPPKAWRWEIYRAGNANPLKRSSIYFETTAAAKRAGKDALKELLNKLFTSLTPRNPATEGAGAPGPLPGLRNGPGERVQGPPNNAAHPGRSGNRFGSCMFDLHAVESAVVSRPGRAGAAKRT